jgi:hypothetical protein
MLMIADETKRTPMAIICISMGMEYFSKCWYQRQRYKKANITVVTA